MALGIFIIVILFLSVVFVSIRAFHVLSMISVAILVIFEIICQVGPANFGSMSTLS